jgi:fucose 4-O-acetylase-like acetyltransferase
VVNIVKGIAIILVVYGHTAQGMVHRGWWASSGAAFSHTFIYSFHMPAFFFVAGLFVLDPGANTSKPYSNVNSLRGDCSRT